MNKKIGFLLVSTSVLGLGIFSQTNEAFAHGYVSSPVSRGYQGQLDKASIGWDSALQKYGKVIDAPQSLEAPKGFPENGPADGKIASANGALGDFVLDKQSSDMWKKSDINTGINTFTWTYTASHSTSKWHYYMTKQGWNPDASLSRDELELIGTVEHDGSAAINNLSHAITIPDDRSGYHIIVAAWDVADTGNAFYSTIDLNVKNNGLPALPTKPTNVKVDNVTKSSVSLSWSAQHTATSYDVYRDGEKISNVSSSKFEDKEVNSDTEYSYEIVALGSTGVASDKSDTMKVKTLSEDAEESTTAPTNLHSMGETESEVSLMWGAASHTSGIEKYDIYRNGEFLVSTEKTSYKDTELKENTTYNYSIKAMSNDGTESDFSNILKVTTKKSEENPSPGEYREFKLGTYDIPESYAKDEVVSYKGDLYTTIQAHSNYGDTSWNPKDATSLFEIKSDGEEEIPSDTTWDTSKVYNAGDTILFEGLKYEAQWWTKGNQPDQSDAWKLVSKEVVKWNSNKAYNGGDQVKFEEKTYTAKWWSKGDKPGKVSVWEVK